MRFREIAPFGALVIEPDPVSDKRGMFARLFDADAFRARGLLVGFVQASTSFNVRRGTLRGLHYRAEADAEAKLVRCTAGAIFDVVVDVRPGSATFGRWQSVELTDENRFTLYVPPGFAHGFETLIDGTEILYQMTAPYAAGADRGILWSDPTLAISWPIPPTVISGRDRALPQLLPI